MQVTRLALHLPSLSQHYELPLGTFGFRRSHRFLRQTQRNKTFGTAPLFRRKAKPTGLTRVAEKQLSAATLTKPHDAVVKYD
jgi:hypothetical protein